MTSITRDLRKDLEKTVKQARRIAEAGARQAVQQLRVGDGDAPKDLTIDQRVLRTRLRAHGRQLGDRRDAKTGAQEIAHLVQECAYEHWHRMLFARFLAETDLLIEPESGVAITLDEVQELAREKATDWLPLASDYAERMLPQIFRKDDPVLEFALPPETRSEMEDLLKGLMKPVFEADDSLGWVYQFWQSEKKDEVNKSEVKIGADELPAVTQLFTEDYMVLFLLHNTLGAWWAGKVLACNPNLATSAADEIALRAACKVGDIDWTYLRFVRETAEHGTEGPWRPAAGVFEGWPRAAKDLTVLDPCMGSGHFLVFALPILVAFRMAEEALSQSVAVDAVLKNNLFGLEIDPRCTQIAAFNLAFAAWRRVGHRPLPQLNLACSGLAIGVTKAEWLKLAEKVVTAADPAAKRDLLGVEKNLLTVGLEERVKNGLEALYDIFAKAPWLGSLIDPRRAGADIFREGFDKLEPLLASILAAADTEDVREMAVAAQGMAKAAELLGQKFTLIATNVPYLGRPRQGQVLLDYCETQFPISKADLATCFIERFTTYADGRAISFAAVTPHAWLNLTRFGPLRTKLLKNAEWNTVVRLGTKAFDGIGGEVVNVSLVSISNRTPSRDSAFVGVDLSKCESAADKSISANTESIQILVQSDQIKNPDARLIIEKLSQTQNIQPLSDFVECYQGLRTGDANRFIRCFWEQQNNPSTWSFYQSTSDEIGEIEGLSYSLRWENGSGQLHRYAKETRSKLHDMHESGNRCWGNAGVAVGQMSLRATRYFGEHFDNTLAVIFPKDPADLPAVTAFCFSTEYKEQVRRIAHGIYVTNQTLIKVPFEIERWREVTISEVSGELKHAATKDSRQWLFDGRPDLSETPLATAVARLVGYCWPRQVGSSFMNFPALGPDGLEAHADADGIVCLTALKGEPPAEQRLSALLASAYGADWSASKLASLLAEAGCAGKSLDDWLRDSFFAQHCELFHQRPVIWHIWDGRRDGFHALVNYHRLAAPNGEGRRTLEKLIYSYLGDWIDDQRKQQQAGVEGADARLAHAEHLKAELIKVLNGEPAYDVFVRWKPLHEQPIDWNPDINDGVRMNIRPFMAARTLNARGANACILRATPKIKWDKDRGKEPTRDKVDYPWFWGWDEATADFASGAAFDGNRWNDLHYSRAVKQAARDRHRASLGGKI
jgi:hypothetical protein